MDLYCSECGEVVPVVSIRMDVFDKPANKRVYHCPKGHEVLEAWTPWIAHQ